MGLRRYRMGGVSLLVATEPELVQKVRNSGLWRSLFPPPSPGTTSAGDATAPKRPAKFESEEARVRFDRTAHLEWYHTIDLGYGVTTPGVFDHRPIMHFYPIPERLDGMRVLDVATYDGYWAFEFERRGAKEVVALDVDCFDDLDLPPPVKARMTREQLARKTGERFSLAKEFLQSNVRREVCSVYDLSPDRLGKFDMVFCGDLLLHLMNPAKALQNMCRVTEGFALIVEYYNETLPLNTLQYMGGYHECVWWQFSYDTLHRMVCDAGFSQVEAVRKFKMGEKNVGAWMPHAAFLCKP
jgi:tRNA (mo5U34)-methyltransferase